MKKITGNSLRWCLIACGAFVAAAGLLLYPVSAADGARRGIGYCLNLLIPSLFPFMVLSAFLVKSGLSDWMGRLFSPVTKFLFRLPGCSAPAILMSLIGGYPVGARAVASLREQNDITEKEAQRMLCFCVNSGPAFVISTVGGMMLGNLRSGILLFFSQILASLILGILCRFTLREPSREHPSSIKAIPQSALIASAADASRGMAAMCSFVILFAVLVSVLIESGISDACSHLLSRLGVPQAASDCLLSVFLEVTGGCMDAVGAGAPLLFLSFAIGWGGLCVHFQVLSAASKIGISRLRFTLFRLLHGILAAFLTNLFFRLFPVTVSVFSSTSQPLSGKLSGSAPAAAVLFLLCMAFLLSVHKNSPAKN